MAEHQKAPQFHRMVYQRIGWIVVLSILPALAKFAGLPISMGWVVGLFIVFGVGIGLLSAHLLRQFRCPKCGALIPHYEPTHQPNTPLLYFCKSCDIVWDSGFRTADD